ncbi:MULTISPECIES: hypothetical protein [Dermacoccus]|uniref:Uncharacterized protein n=3 Tax=Dermacoccus TaxID=57495 RepID=A0A417Z3Q4_9MICO|nr:hypothetical protein [Dermacoccus abyssi]RHW45332.1 hypothetical protein D1832_09475 [Dermacoccus abyssi]
MDSSNHWYGHAHVLAEYCGLDAEHPPRINGVIQHGWTFVHGFGYGHNPPGGFAKYVWGDVNRRRGQAIGWRDYVTIGAPFLYLDRLRPRAEDAPEPEGTIWFPFHGTVDWESVHGDHDRLIREIQEVEDGPVTMCLYYVEYEQDEIRERYEEAGFRVITLGQRGTFYQGGTTNFLERQLDELRKHKRVASNRLSTAMFYGIASGLDPAVYGDPMDIPGIKQGFDGTHLLEKTFPELHGVHLDLEQARAVCDEELGRDYLMSPTELGLALGWADEMELLR